MIRWAMRQFVSWHARRVQRSMMEPREAQGRVLERLKRHLGGVRSLDELRALPAADEDSLRAQLKQAFETGVFAGSRLFGFVRTSGSRGEPKRIPITKDYLASLDRTLVRMVCSHLLTAGDWASLFSGRHVFLSSRPRVGVSPTGLPIFDASALYPTRAQWFTRWALLPRHADLWLDDWALKRERILEQARGKNVVSLNGLPALAIDFARHAKEKYGVRHLDEVWPQLSLFSYGGVPFRAAQRQELVASVFSPGHAFTFLETYFASEAPLGFVFDPRDDALALNTLENLYLFRRGSDVLLADELREGERYSLHVTTPGGLVNFHMGDLVDVVSTRPLLVRVAGREGEELSMTGEKITVAQIDLALSSAGFSGVNLPVVWKSGGERQHLVWGTPAGLDAARLDEALCAANELYAEALRVERVIDGSEIVSVPDAVFEAHRQARLGNYKPKRLFESRDAFTAEYGF